MSLKAAVRRHRWAIAAIFIASWGWALAWPQGDVEGASGVVEFRGAAGERFSGSYAHVVRGWGVSGVFREGTSGWSLERIRGDLRTPVSPLEARALIEARDSTAFGHTGWFVDPGSLALACWLGTLFSVVSSVWWVALRRPAAPGTPPGRAIAVALGMAIWPALVLGPAAWSVWRRLGHPRPQTIAVLDPEVMILATVYLVSAIAVVLGRARPTAT